MTDLDETQAAVRDWIVVRSLAIGAAVVAGLCTFPSAEIWDLGGKPFHPFWTLVLVACVALLMPAIERGYERKFTRADETWPWSMWPAWLRAVGAIAVIALLGGGFFALSSDENYGDAERVVHFVSRGAWFHKRAPLSMASFQLAHQFLDDPRACVQLVSSLAGGLAVLAVANFAGLLAPGRRALQVALSLAILTTGTVVLFFGHVEHYALPASLAMTFIYLGTKSILRDESMVPAAIAASLAAAVHLSMLTIMPALTYLCWVRCIRGRTWSAAISRTAVIAAITLIPAALLYFGMQEVGYLRAGERGFGGGDGRMFVPLTKLTGRAHYLFLRPDHLLAIANEQLLTAPMALFSCCVLGIGLWIKVAGNGERGAPFSSASDTRLARIFVALVASGFFALTVIWNPDLGALRDWNLFASAGILLSMLAVYLMSERWTNQPARIFACAVLIIAVNLHRTVPWLYHNLVSVAVPTPRATGVSLSHEFEPLALNGNTHEPVDNLVQARAESSPSSAPSPARAAARLPR